MASFLRAEASMVYLCPLKKEEKVNKNPAASTNCQGLAIRAFTPHKSRCTLGKNTISRVDIHRSIT
jgi:hypothetical protein